MREGRLVMRLVAFAMIAVAVAAVAAVLAVSQARADCPSIPRNAVWGKVGDGAVVRYVVLAFYGAWNRYIAKWQARLDRARDAAKRNGALVFHDSGLWLRGADLQKYVSDIQGRLAAMRCLAATAPDSATTGAAVAGTATGGGS